MSWTSVFQNAPLKYYLFLNARTKISVKSSKTNVWFWRGLFVLLNPHPPKKGVWCPSVYKLSKPLGECSKSDCWHGEQWFSWCWFGGWLLGFNLFFMAKGDNSGFHLLYYSSGRNQARFSTRKKILAWPLFCLFFHLPPDGSLAGGEHSPHHERGASSVGSALYIVSICCWEASSWSQVIKSHFCFQWHPSSWEGDWQLCECTCFSTGSPSTAGQLESVFSLRCPHTVVRLEFLWMWLKKVCVWATITNKLCSALQHTDQERAWPHYQNSNPDGEESPPNEGLSVISKQISCQSCHMADGDSFQRQQSWGIQRSSRAKQRLPPKITNFSRI